MADDSSNPKQSDLGAYVASEAAGAERDYQNVRSRALNLVTTSGGFVALVSGLLAIAIGSSKATVPTDSRWMIAVSLASFVASTVFALLINRPQLVMGSKAEQLKTFVENDWDSDGWDRSIAKIRVEYIKSLRKDNRTTAKWLSNSIGFQIGGITFIAVSILLMLLHSK